MPPSHVPESAENIMDYGATEGDDSQSAVNDNVSAIDSASENSDDSLVYLPEGIYYIGPNDNLDRARYMRPGHSSNTGAAGLSFVGDGAEKSYLKVSGQTIDEDDGHLYRIHYDNDADHGVVTFKYLTFDGNRKDVLPNDAKGEDTRLYGFHFDGDYVGFEFERARFQHTHEAMFNFGSGYYIEADYCTFHDAAIGRHNQAHADGDVRTDHMFSNIWLGDGDYVHFHNCYFSLVSGNMINQDAFNFDNEIIIEDCWIEGAGASVCKDSGTKNVELTRVYIKLQTQELLDEIDDDALDNDFTGRYFYRFPDGEGTVNLRLEDCHFESSNGRAIVFDDIADGEPDEFRIYGPGPVRIENIDGDRGAAVIVEQDDHPIVFDDLDELSIHNSDQPMFSTPNGEGSIGNFRHDNANSIGDRGSISFDREDDGGDPFDPDVPSRIEVGHDGDIPDTVRTRVESIDGIRQTTQAVVQMTVTEDE